MGIKRLLRYVFFIAFILWILVSIFVLYRYVWSVSKQVESKGGTFVEGIFDSTSYLPYLRTDLQSVFYQGLLFNRCLKYSITPEGEHYQEDLCKVTTKDNKSYTITFDKQIIRSDGTPVSIDDFIFSYQDIIIKNKRNIKTLSVYKDITLTQDTQTQLTVTFPRASVDNKLFFTNFILPKHILQTFDLQGYREVFAVQPTYTNCANIVSQTTDQYSLIFNLVNCKDTNLNFYQIKNLVTPESFATTIADKGSSIVDAYLGETTFKGYQAEKLLTNKIITLFFNTDSPKLKVRTRRVLGGLIKRNFYTTGYDTYLIKNSDGLFDTFLSTGANVQDYLDRSYTEEGSIAKQDLLDSGIKPLPTDITISKAAQPFVFLGENLPTSKSLIAHIDSVYTSFVLEKNGKTYPVTYIEKDKKSTFSLALSSGLNQYTLWGFKKGKKEKVATIDLYNFIQNTPSSSGTQNTIQPITILYYNTPLYISIVENLKQIFATHAISAYFSFESVNTPQELEGRLLLGDYDIVINTIDMGLKKDITKLFSTDNAKSNPSHYQNAQLISHLQNYISKPSPRLLNQINDIYSKDMPFVILGKSFLPINFKHSLVDAVFGSGSDIILYDYNWRDTIYQKLKLVKNIHIDGKKVWNYDNFLLFLKTTIGIQPARDTSEPQLIPLDLSGTTNE